MNAASNEPTEKLDALMRAVLAELELISQAPVLNVDRAGSHGKPESKPPPGLDAPHLRYRRRYENARTVATKRLIIMEALAELRSTRYSRHPDVDRGTVEGRLRIGLDQREPWIVAYVYGYTVSHVYKLRAQAKQLLARMGT